jgi:hypothetical protein
MKENLKIKKHMNENIMLQADWCYLGVKLQQTDILINNGNFQEALNLANKVWLKIKENGIENKVKENSGT